VTRSEAGKLGALKVRQNGTLTTLMLKRIVEYESHQKLCKTCGDKIPYHNRTNTYCNHTCAARTNNIGITRNRKPWIPKLCIKCNELCKKGRKYCPSCIKNKGHVHFVKEWAEVKTNRSAKRILIQENGHVCEQCLLTIWNNVPIPIELNHKDGNSDNYSRENVELLCPNCHALTPNYKGKNKYNGSSRQKMRRERYKAGKTY
jgi:Zn finger protein HypA/HybF involved in hydrogenase expression